MGQKHGPQNQARGTNEKRNANSARLGNQKLGRAGAIDGDESVGVGSENRIGASLITLQFAIVGGILTQLIDEEKSQLGKHQECIEWYGREVERSQSRIEALEKLRLLMDQRSPESQREV